MTDITFSARFNTIGSEEYRPVIQAFGENNVRLGVLVQAPRLSIRKPPKKLFPKALKARKVFVGFIRKLLGDRLQDSQMDPKDIFSFVQQATNPDTGKSLDLIELSAEIALLIVAGKTRFEYGNGTSEKRLESLYRI